MLQEYIPGGDDSVWMFNGYFDRKSDCVLGFTGQKLRQWPPHRGVTTLGICRHNPTVEDTTCRFMKAVGYRGVLDIGYRWDARDGLYKVPATSTRQLVPPSGCSWRTTAWTWPAPSTWT